MEEEKKGLENLDTSKETIAEQRKGDNIKKLIDRCNDEKVMPVVYILCKDICSVSTFYNYIKDSVELNRAYRDKELACGLMIESKLVSKALDGDNTCMVFYLKNKHNSYKDKLKIEGALEINDYDKLTDKELTERIRKYTEKLGAKGR